MTSLNLSRAIEGFLLHQDASGRSKNTIRNYRQDLKRFLEYVTDLPIDEVSTPLIEDYFSYLKNDFRFRQIATTPIPPRKLSNKTLSNTQGTLAVFWKWVSREFRLPNPFNIPPIRFYSKPILPITSEEIEKLIYSCKTIQKNPTKLKPYEANRNTHKRDKAIILLLLDTGIRVSELCSANVDDLDMETGRLFVTGKGNKSRYVYQGKVCRKALWSYLSERYPDQKPISDDPLFMDQHNLNRLTRQGILELLKRIGERAKVNNIHPHRFRHTFAIEFLRNGGNVFELQQLLGHSDLETAKKYIYLAQSDLESSIRRASPVDRWNIRH